MKSFKEFILEQSQTPTIKCDVNGMCKVIREYESGGNYKKILSRYLDSKGLPTIGHGHLITPESQQIFQDVFPAEHAADKNWGLNVLEGRTAMTMPQVEKLFARDIEVRIPQVKELIPDFENFTPELQNEVMSEHFRGMLGKSKKSLKLMNAGDFVGAANEYLDSKEYRESKEEKAKSPGIAKRYENLSNALKTEVARRQKRQQSSRATTQAPQ